MRRIGAIEYLEKKRKLNTSVISICLLGLLVLSSLGYAFMSGFGYNNNPEIDDNLESDKITINYEGQIFGLLSTYEDVKNIEVNISSRPIDYYGGTLYIASDNVGASQEIAATLGRFSQRVQESCYGKCDKNLPEKNCTENIIVWNQSLESKVYQKDKCVFIDGDMKAVDAFIYKLFSY